MEIGTGVKFIHDDDRREDEAKLKARRLGYTIEKSDSLYKVSRAGDHIVTCQNLDQLEDWLERAGN